MLLIRHTVLNMTVLSMSYDQTVVHAVLGKNYFFLSLKLMGQSPLVLICLLRDIGLAKYVQMMDILLG